METQSGSSLLPAAVSVSGAKSQAQSMEPVLNPDCSNESSDGVFKLLGFVISPSNQEVNKDSSSSSPCRKRKDSESSSELVRLSLENEGKKSKVSEIPISEFKNAPVSEIQSIKRNCGHEKEEKKEAEEEENRMESGVTAARDISADTSIIIPPPPPTQPPTGNNPTQAEDVWCIKKKLTKSDVGNHCRMLLTGNSVGEHILPFLSDGDNNKINNGDGVTLLTVDEESGTEHRLVLKKWKNWGNYVLNGCWKSEFVNRRGLKAEDEIGMYWDSVRSRLIFRVLQRSPRIDQEPPAPKEPKKKYKLLQLFV